MSIKNKVAIVGADETDEIGIVPNMTPIMMHAQAARNALRDAGIEKSEVDAVFTCGVGGMAAVQLCEYLGIVPKYIDSTMTGGSSFEVYVRHAAAAIAAGLCSVALITHGETGFSSRNRRGPRGGGFMFDTSLPSAQFEAPYGVGGPPSNYAMAAMRHMHEYGTTSEQLAEVAVATRKWAQLNPRAMMRDPLTIDDVLSSRWIAYPFHIYDCCLVTDAGGAVVVVGADRARDFAKKPVWVLGSGESTTHQSLLGMDDVTRTPARYSARAAFDDGRRHARRHRRRRGVRLLHLHGDGDAGRAGLLREGRRRAVRVEPAHGARRRLPDEHERRRAVVHAPGMYGMFILIEAVRQLRGECGERQVPDARLALVNGTGGLLSATGTLILGRD